MGSKRKKKEDRDSACSQLFEEALGEDDQAEEVEHVPEPAGAGQYSSFLKPIQGKKVWIVLIAILIVIAVIVLYVYQAGDRKTILGNQPIPAGQLDVQNMPVTGGQGGMVTGPGAANVPVGGTQVARNVFAPGAGGASTSTVQCPQCGMQGLPVCHSCGAVMQPLGDGSGLFACPLCGSVGIPICPRDGGHMTLLGGAGFQPAAGIAAGTGGQFQCPACGATGLPRWSHNGTPVCPSCGARMTVNSASKPSFAASLWPGG